MLLPLQVREQQPQVNPSCARSGFQKQLVRAVLHGSVLVVAYAHGQCYRVGDLCGLRGVDGEREALQQHHGQHFRFKKGLCEGGIQSMDTSAQNKIVLWCVHLFILNLCWCVHRIISRPINTHHPLPEADAPARLEHREIVRAGRLHEPMNSR